MKKTIFSRVLSVLLALLLCSLVFVGCNEADDTTDEPDTGISTELGSGEESGNAESSEVSQKGFCTIVLEGTPATEYRVNLDDVTGNQGLISVLEVLKAKEGLTYAESGGMLSQVGNVTQDAANGVYLYIWTSVQKDFDVSQYASTKQYGDLTLTSAGVGAAQMSLEKDALIYIGTIVWS